MADPVNQRAGRTTDGRGVIGEVRLYCQKYPSVELGLVVKNVRFQMAAVGL